MSSSRIRVLLALSLGLLAGAAISACGADHLQAPAPPPKKALAPLECRSIEQLMPRFLEAIATGRTEGFRRVVLQHLLEGERPGTPPPMADVLRTLFTTLSGFAKQPPELGALPGELCAPWGVCRSGGRNTKRCLATVECEAGAVCEGAPPLPDKAHPLCEMRRALEVLVHEGKGIDALRRMDPLLGGIVNYVIGRPPEGPTPHFEVAGVISDLCAQKAVCKPEDTLDLVVAFTAFTETPEGRAAVERFTELASHPGLQPLLNDDGNQYGGEKGIVALVKVVITTTLGMDDPADLDALPIDQMPGDLQPLMRQLLGDTKLLLDPKRVPNMQRPLKKALNCLNVQDPSSHLVRMVYRLGLESRIKEFGLTSMTQTLKELMAIDKRGTIIHLVGTLAKAVRQDEQALGSLARVCSTLFSVKTSSSQPQSNAELALPVLSDLFAQKIGSEALCAVDALVYGCSGGALPACR
jgi:hypothetical protein